MSLSRGRHTAYCFESNCKINSTYNYNRKMDFFNYEGIVYGVCLEQSLGRSLARAPGKF